jgi:hypothetical protein
MYGKPTKNEILYKEIQKREDLDKSLRESLKLLLKDIKEGRNVIVELENMLKYERTYKSKVSFKEWCVSEGYIAGFGRYEKDGKSYPKVEVEQIFYK